MTPPSSTQDGDRELIDLAFRKKANGRVEWAEWLRCLRVRASSRPLASLSPCVRSAHRAISAARYLSQPRYGRDLYSDFINKELILSSWPTTSAPYHLLWTASSRARESVLQTKVEERNQGTASIRDSLLHFHHPHSPTLQPHRPRNPSDTPSNTRRIITENKV
jgi:hypothetical protein